MRSGTAGRWAVVCLVAGATVMGCDCDDGTRLMKTPPDKTLRVDTSDVVSCDGAKVKLEPLVYGGTPPYEFQWEPASHVTSAKTVATMADAEETRTYTLTVTDKNGWTASGTTKVERRGVPKAALRISAGRPVGCIGEAVTLDATGSAAFDGGKLATFEWDLGDGNGPRASSDQLSATVVPKDGQTVSLKVTDAGGCSATATMPLEVRQPPVPQVRFTLGSGSICSGGQVALDGSASRDAKGRPVVKYAWNLDADASTIESTAAATAPYVPTGAPAMLTVTDDLGCTATSQATIALKPLPTAKIQLAQASSLVCAGAPVALDGSLSTDASGAPVASYAWDYDANGSIDATDAKPASWTAAGKRTVKLTVTDAQGCTSDTALDITPRAAPQLPWAVAAGRTDGCLGDRLTLSAAGALDADGNPVASYSWDIDGDGVSDATGASADVTLKSAVVAKVTVADAQGCTAQAAIPLSPRALPTVVTEFVQGTADVCAGEQVVLDGSKSRDQDGKPVASYAWELDGDASTVDGVQAKTSPWAPGGSPAKLTVTDARGCSASQVVSIAVRSRPQAVIRASASGADVCMGTDVTLDASGSTPVDGTSALKFAWDLDGDASTVESTVAKPPALRVNQPSSAKVTVTDANGCTADASVSFSPRANPTVPPLVLSGDPTGCMGDLVHLSAAGAVDADGNPVNAYAWDLDGDGTPDSSAATADVTLAKAGPVSVKVTDAKGCSTTMATTLSPRALPTPRVTFAVGAASVCSGDVVALDASGSSDADGKPVTSYAWDLDGDPGSLEGESAITGRFVPTGIPAHLTVADSRGCKASLDTTFTVRTPPTASIAFKQGSSAVCDGTTIAVDGSGSKDASGAPVARYAWDFDSDPSTVESTQAAPPAFVTAGGRDVRLTVTDATGCSGEKVIRLTSRALPTMALAIVQGRADACLGDAVQLSAAGTLDADGQAVSSFSWDYAEEASPVTSVTTPAFVPAASELVTVTAVDSYGCRAQATQALSARPLPTPIVQFTKGSSTTCSGDLVSLDGGSSHDADGNPVRTYAWDLDGDPATLESTGIGSGSFDPRSGPATLTVTDVKGCRASLTKTVAVNALPVPRIAWASGAAKVCDGTQVVLDGSGSTDAVGGPVASYAWDLDGVSSTVEGTGATAPAFSASGIRTATLTVRDGNGCQASTSATTTSRGLPTARIAASSLRPQICSGDQVTLSGSGSTDVDGAPVASYAWDLDGNGSTTESTAAQPPALTVTGTKTVSLVVTDSFGCRNSASQALAARALPTPIAQFTKGGAQACSGDLVALDGAASHDADGNPVAVYAWNLDTDPATVESSVAASGSFDPRNGPATLTVTDAKGCRASLTKSVTVNALPVPRIAWASGAAKVCDGTQVVLDGSASTDALGAPVASYAWDLDGVSSTVEGTGATAPAFSATGVRTATLTVRDGNGCQASTSATTTARGLPTARIAASGPRPQICSGDQVTLTGSSSTDVDGSPVASYAWDLDGNASTVESTVAQPPALTMTSAKTVSLVVTDAFGCKAGASSTVSPRALPTPLLSFASGRADVCAGGSVSLTSAGSLDADGNPVARTTWDVQSDGFIDASTTQTPPFVPGGSQTVKMVVTDALGCSATTTQLLSPRALPVVDVRYAQGAALVCAGGTVQFDGSGSKDADGALPATLAWDTNGDGTTDQTGSLTSVWTPASATTVYLKATDRKGCSSTGSKSFTVHGLPTARITFTQGSAAVCAGTTVQISGATSTDVNGAQVSSYAWDLDGNGSTVESTAAAPGAFALAATRTATLQVTDSEGCSAKATQTLTANPLPVANAGADAAFCAGGSANLGAAAVSGTSYAWSPSSGLSSTSVANPKATPSATTVYHVTATNTYGCTAGDDVQVTVWPVPTVDAGPDRSVAAGGSVALLGTSSGGTSPLAVAWTPASSLSSASVLQPRAQPSSDTRYDVTVTDVNGCKAADYTYVEVLPPLSVNLGPDMRLCRDSGKRLALTAKVTSGVAPFTYAWTSSPDCGSCLTTTGPGTASVLPPVDTTFTVTVTDANGTSATDSMLVHPIDRLVVDAGPDRTVTRGMTTQLGAPGEPGITYAWSCSKTSCGISDYASSQPVVQPDGTTAYTVVATDGATCTAQDTVLVSTDPLIIATVPVEGYNPWERDAPIFVIFDTDMDATSFAGNVSLLDPGDGTNIWITTSYDPATRMLVVTPQDSCGTGCTGDHRYWNNRPYLLVLKGGAGGVRAGGIYGQPLYNDMTLEFVVSSVGDGAAPQIVYRQPAWGASGVMTDTEVVMKFDEPEDPRSVNASTIWINGIPGSVTYDPRTWTATLRLSQRLAPNTAYVVNVVGVKDGVGNATATNWTFTTGPSGDTTPPAVTSSNPANGATNVDVASILSVTFSEPIDTSTIGRLKLTDVTTGTPIAGKVLYDEATRTATLEPKSFLEPLHNFRIDLNGLVDQAGNTLPSWSCAFTAAPALIAERFESLPVGWSFQSPWALDYQAARAGTSGLSDSPGTRYANSATRIATTPALNVSGKSSVSVSMWTRRTLDTNADTAYVESSPDGTTWTTLATLTGPTGWRTQTVSAPTNGKPTMYVRLRLVSDSTVNLDGWFVDDFVVR